MEVWTKRTNPNIEVEAVRLNEDNAAQVAAWCGGELVEEISPEHPQEMQPGVNVETGEGTKRASLHMYVVKFGKHFFVSHVRPFEEKYKPATRQPSPPESAGDARHQRGFSDPWGGTLGGRPM